MRSTYDIDFPPLPSRPKFPKGWTMALDFIAIEGWTTIHIDGETLLSQSNNASIRVRVGPHTFSDIPYMAGIHLDSLLNGKSIHPDTLWEYTLGLLRLASYFELRPILDLLKPNVEEYEAPRTLSRFILASHNDDLKAMTSSIRHISMFPYNPSEFRQIISVARFAYRTFLQVAMERALLNYGLGDASFEKDVKPHWNDWRMVAEIFKGLAKKYLRAMEERKH